MRRTKYGSRAVKAEASPDGRYYASVGEMRRAQELRLLEGSGAIQDLRFQVRFPIVVEGEKVCTYVADFTYMESERWVVEDYKGFETPEFKLKWKLLQALYPGNEFRLTGGKNGAVRNRSKGVIPKGTGGRRK